MKSFKFTGCSFDDEFLVIGGADSQLRPLMFVHPLSETLTLVCQFVAFADEPFLPLFIPSQNPLSKSKFESKCFAVFRNNEAVEASGGLNYGGAVLEGNLMVGDASFDVHLADGACETVDCSEETIGAAWEQRFAAQTAGLPFVVLNPEVAARLPRSSSSGSKPLLEERAPKKYWPLAAAFVLCLPLGYNALGTMNYLKKAEHATGKVIFIEAKDGLCGQSKFECTRLSPVIEFKTPNGAKHIVTGLPPQEIRGHHHAVDKSEWTVGASVKLLYDPATPAQARLDRFLDLWGSALAFAVIIVTLLALYFVDAILRLVRDRKISTPNHEVVFAP